MKVTITTHGCKGRDLEAERLRGPDDFYEQRTWGNVTVECAAAEREEYEHITGEEVDDSEIALAAFANWLGEEGLVAETRLLVG